jgi:membrane protease YdiL (CAAX protease family)
MIGLILIAVSWILLRVQNRPLSELGFNKPLQRLLEFMGGLLIAGLFATIQFILTSHFAEFEWVVNPSLGVDLVLESLRWNINSVLYEELVFRGYLLYKAIELLGARKACLLSAAAFGVYHWFSYGIFGNLVPMVYVFLLTGSFGLMLSFSFSMSKSVILPIALHLGWNIVTILVFSNGPLGAQLLVPSSTQPMPMSVVEQLITTLLVPISLVVLVLWLVTRRIRRYGQSSEGQSGAAG